VRLAWILTPRAFSTTIRGGEEGTESDSIAGWRTGLGTPRIELRLPKWIDGYISEPDRRFETTEARMRYVILLAGANVERRTGGPFGAAVFEADSGRVVGVGVNVVEASNCSLAHAEMLAIALAQQAVGNYDLGQGSAAHELVTSAEPCAMCLGAIPWSGVRRVVCGARGKDACEIGFDEGAKPARWVAELRKRGIEVVRDVLRDEACAVLRLYAQTGGHIYNARQGP
jgi:tRNA(Arg) A34 adenosine deaminase TadA